MKNVKAENVGQDFLKVKQHYLWLDVRTLNEYRQGHIPGSIHIPYDELELRAEDELEEHRHQPILLVSQNGKRSQLAMETLHRLGFDSLFQLEGGMECWTGPVE